MDENNRYKRGPFPSPFLQGAKLVSAVFFVVALFLLAGCLDIPNDPNTAKSLESANVYVIQKGNSDSTNLKILPSDSSYLGVAVNPQQYSKSLSFSWWRDKQLLGEESKYQISPSPSQKELPNRVLVTDPEGNQMEISFQLSINTSPKMDYKTTPSQGDTLVGDSTIAHMFHWSAMDSDKDDLFYTLEIDSQSYPMGSLTMVHQSGFKPGEHKFRVIVKDTFGDQDSIPWVPFYVIEREGEAP